jgi:hypothetical protein
MDFQFSFEKLDNTAHVHAARLAVMYPLVNGLGKSEEEQLEAMYTIQRMWRARLYVLHKANWNKLRNARMLQYARNCWPSMALTTCSESAARLCKWCDICPWCYSRRVKNICALVHKALKSGFSLTYAHFSYYEPIAQSRSIRLLLEYHRKRLFKLVTANVDFCSGLFWLLTAEPCVEEQHTDDWKFTYRILAILEPGEAFDWIPDVWCSQAFTDPTQEQLRTAISRTMHYPVGLMRGDPGNTVKVLEAKEKMRFNEAYGSLRHEKNKPEVVENKIIPASQSTARRVFSPGDYDETE